jgi:FkbM family methyltransferase
MLTTKDGRLRKINGYAWPLEDIECFPAVFEQVADIEEYYKHCEKFDVCVQAGGNCGVFADQLANRFGTVYTFEPDWENFYCLSRNIVKPNVVKFMAALGSRHELVGMKTKAANIGAHRVEGHGCVPTIKIDDLALDALDLAILDIEGYELNALMGGEYAISRFKPVIVIEDKGHITKYGHKAGDIYAWLERLGYARVAAVRRDTIWVCL